MKTKAMIRPWTKSDWCGVPEKRRGVGRACTYGEAVDILAWDSLFAHTTHFVSFLYRITTWLGQNIISNFYLT
jgi:hypothetical protein